MKISQTFQFVFNYLRCLAAEPCKPHRRQWPHVESNLTMKKRQSRKKREIKLSVDRVGQTHHYWVTGLVIFPPQSHSPFQGHTGCSVIAVRLKQRCSLHCGWTASCLMYYIFWLPPTTHTDKIPAGTGQRPQCQHSVYMSFLSQDQHACAYDHVCPAT